MLRFFALLLSLHAACTEDFDVQQTFAAAASQGELAVVQEILLSHRDQVDIDAQGSGRQSPLMAASLGGHSEVIRLLLQEGADPTVPEQDGYTPMHGVAFQGRAEAAKVLIEHGLDIADMHSDGVPAWMRACWGGRQRHAETVKVFLEAGADYKQQNQQGATCMHQTKNKHTIQVLQDWEKKVKADQDEM
eukprot:NODE_5321_length_707_cov_59.725862_g5298_i0.p1 GENE.NODE_5321_length_707_cov_59.725862_g5298_i0~~NODE_5321_length_707_cov_59.725862_g5298_i0.p1  ORF type:complete len:190 (+),score=33.81 NODE_5321_length_707_cov_59.725862_g5298_i0:61-630(+)